MITGYELIEKMYSEIQEEKLYSTGDSGLDELLERAFCEGYEYAQKEFARRDYEGLSDSAQEVLRKKRSDYAKQLRTVHNDLVKGAKNGIMGKLWDDITSTGEIQAGGVKSNFKTKSSRAPFQSRKDFNDFHRNAMLQTMLDTTKDAKKVMRLDTEGKKHRSFDFHRRMKGTRNNLNTILMENKE